MRLSARLAVRPLRRRGAGGAGGWGAAGAILVGEAALAGFYIAVTRGLAPVIMASAGLSLKEILFVAMAASAAALAALHAVGRHGVGALHRSLVIVHAVERLVWMLLPLAALEGVYVLVPVYAAGMSLASLSGLLITATIFSLFDEAGARRVIAGRTAASAASNIAGQLVAVTVLAASRSYMKYFHLYVLASGVGLVASVLLALHPLYRGPARASGGAPVEEETVSGAVMLYMLLYMAGASVLAVAWAPYLMRVLGAPDYLAASLGLAQMLSSIAASVYWASRSYPAYRYAVTVLPLVPVAVALTPLPPAHLAIAGGYAFAATAANLLASFQFARLSRSLGAFRSSLKIAEAAAAAQTLGLATALAATSLGAWAALVVSAVYLASAAFTALYALPEVALVPREQALLHARRLYTATSAAMGFVVVVSRRTAIAVARTLALTAALLILVLAYRVLYYLIILAG